MRCVRPAFTTSVELVGLGPQRRGQVLERGDQVGDDGLGGGQVDGRGEHVVGRLAGVDVVVGVTCLAGLTRGCAPPAGRSPRWRSCSTRCPSRSGTRRPGTGRRGRRRHHLGGRGWHRRAPSTPHVPGRGVDPAASALISPRARMRRRWMGRPEIGKFSTARWVWAPHARRPGRAPPPWSRARSGSARLQPWCWFYPARPAMSRTDGQAASHARRQHPDQRAALVARSSAARCRASPASGWSRSAVPSRRCASAAPPRSSSALRATVLQLASASSFAW